MQYVLLGLSITTGIFYILTLFFNKNNTTKQDAINNSIKLLNISSKEEKMKKLKSSFLKATLFYFGLFYSIF